MCLELKRRRGRYNLKTLVGTFTILLYVKNFVLIFLSRIVTQSALYIFEMKLNRKFVDKKKTIILKKWLTTFFLLVCVLQFLRLCLPRMSTIYEPYYI